MTQRAKRIYGIGSGRKIASGVIVWSLFSVFFLGWGAIESVKTGQPQWFPLLFGALAVVIAIIVYRRAKDMGIQC